MVRENCGLCGCTGEQQGFCAGAWTAVCLQGPLDIPSAGARKNCGMCRCFVLAGWW